MEELFDLTKFCKILKFTINEKIDLISRLREKLKNLNLPFSNNTIETLLNIKFNSNLDLSSKSEKKLKSGLKKCDNNNLINLLKDIKVSFPNLK